VDSYFESVFPDSYVGYDFLEIQRTIKASLLKEYDERYHAALERKATRNYLPNMTTREGRLLKDFGIWRRTEVMSRLDQLRHDIAHDIIACLQTGRIPIAHINQPETFALRKRLGLDASHVFYASGHLINDIQIDVRFLEDDFAWA
jgi:hypothetical protein